MDHSLACVAREHCLQEEVQDEDHGVFDNNDHQLRGQVLGNYIPHEVVVANPELQRRWIEFPGPGELKPWFFDVVWKQFGNDQEVVFKEFFRAGRVLKDF